MFKKYIGSLGIAMVLSLSVLSLPTNASADSLDMEESDSSGYVVIDDNDKVLFSSGLGMEDEEYNPLLRAAYYDWQYFTSHRNYLNNYKWGHSYYYNMRYRHWSSAKIGTGPTVTARANKNATSYAIAKGYGTFYASCGTY